MTTSILNSKRHRQILSGVVRAYVGTGEPVSSRTIAGSHTEELSPATVRAVMAHLEEAGYLYQPHTSAGRVPTASAYRFFAQQVLEQGTITEEDRQRIHSELESATTPEALAERAGHVLAAVSRGLGIIVMPPLARTVLEHIRFVGLPDGRVVVVLVSAGGATREKIIRPAHEFTQAALDRTVDFLNRHYNGWTLEAIRADVAAKLASERERYDCLVAAQELCDPAVLESDAGRQVYVEGTAQFASAPELAGAEALSELLSAIEEKKKLVTLLDGCIEAPEPVHIQIGVEEISAAGPHLSLITAPYSVGEQGGQGSLGVLGPMRMEYERAITTVAYLARAFSELMSRNH